MLIQNVIVFPIRYSPRQLFAAPCVAETERLESVVLIALRTPLGLKEVRLSNKLALARVKCWKCIKVIWSTVRQRCGGAEC